MREIWPDTAVEENNLTVNISGLRKALGETTATPRWLITVPGRGYRFASATAVAPRSRRSLSMLAAAAVLIAAFAVGFWRWLSPGAPHTVAILPFRVLNQDAHNEYLGLGLADALITRLGNVRAIVVRPLASVLRLAGKDPFQAGRELGADFILEGAIQTAGDRIRVSVRLMRVRDCAPLWAESFDKPADNALTLEDSISGRVAGSLLRRLSGQQQSALAKRPTSNPAAYADYLRGRYHATRYTEGGFRTALRYLRSAIDADPAYALAYSGLADTYYDASNLILAPAEAMPLAKAAARKAVELDPSLGAAHVSLGLIASKDDWNWRAAQEEFRLALSLEPNSAMAHQW